MEAKSDILLILDLDETLVYATEVKLDIQEDFMFDEYYVYKRPGLDNFLIKIKDHFKIGIWSSAGDEYVSEIVIKAFMGDQTDRELQLLHYYLVTIRDANNVRKIEKRNWRRI